MDSAYNVSDPTDWLQTTLPTFSPLENALRCQVCKDFFNTPMITTCSHTFCSICIRRCLSSEGKCPACRAMEQASKLRRNWAVEEVVANFQAARPAALEIARRSKELESEEHNAQRPSKRRRVEQPAATRDDGTRRQTRSRAKQSQPVSSQDPVEIMDTDEEYHNEQEVTHEPDDGLVSCPMCGKRMKEEAVYSHLDHCDGEKKPDKQRKRYSSVHMRSDRVLQMLTMSVKLPHFQYRNLPQDRPPHNRKNAWQSSVTLY